MLSITLVLFTSLPQPSSHHCLHSHYPLPITVSTLTTLFPSLSPLSLPSSHHCLHSHYPLLITVSTLTTLFSSLSPLSHVSSCLDLCCPLHFAFLLSLLVPHPCLSHSSLYICSPLLQFQPHHWPLSRRVCPNRHCLGDCMHLRVLLLLLEITHTRTHTQICTCNSDYQQYLDYILESVH